MKLAAANTDIGPVDTATKGAGRSGLDKQVSDGTAPPFEDLLADLQGESKTAASTNDVVPASSDGAPPTPVSIAISASISVPPPPSKAISIAARMSAGGVLPIPKDMSAGGGAIQVDKSVAATAELDGLPHLVPADASSSIAQSSIAQSCQAIEPAKEGPTIIDALVSMLGKDAANGRNTKSSTPVQKDDSRVATLLKRLGSKDDATDPAPATTVGAAPAVPDAFSALLVGQALPAAPASASLSLPAASAEAVKDVVGASVLSGFDRSAGVLAKAPTASNPSSEPVVADVSISSHLAPFTVAQTAHLDDNRPGLAEAKVDSNDATHPERHTAQESQPTDLLVPSHEAPSPVLATQTMVAGPTSTPVHAIAKAIVALSSHPVTADVASGKPTTAVARTMTLQMSPASLGTVAIKMHMTGQTLDVHLAISDPQTLGMVTRERDSLAAALHDRQYDLNSLVIQDAGATGSLGGNNASQGDATGSRTAQDQRGGDSSAGQRSAGREGEGSSQSPRRERRDGQDAGVRASGDARRNSLFV